MPEPGSKRLLVVEDEGMLILMLSDILEQLGHQVAYMASTILGALTIIQTHGADLDGCLLDANLRGEFATPVARALRQARIPFLVISGYERRELIRLELTEPAIAKPYNAKDIQSALLRL